MFDKKYQFLKVGCNKGDSIPKKTDIYRFKTEKNKVYEVLVEHYSDNIYAVKFYLADHSRSKKKYNFLINDYNAARVIRTVVDIMLLVLQSDQMASLGFIGSEKIKRINNKVEKEEAGNTQKYRIYSYLTNNYFGLDYFEHFKDTSNSSYLLINKRNTDIKSLVDRTAKMLGTLYPALENVEYTRVSRIG